MYFMSTVYERKVKTLLNYGIYIGEWLHYNGNVIDQEYTQGVRCLDIKRRTKGLILFTYHYLQNTGLYATFDNTVFVDIFIL